jgi:hypothetical protein
MEDVVGVCGEAKSGRTPMSDFDGIEGLRIVWRH